MPADHRQDRGDGERLERDEGDREHETHRQRSPRWRPNPVCRGRLSSLRFWPCRICAHQGEVRTSTAVEVKPGQARAREPASRDAPGHALMDFAELQARELRLPRLTLYTHVVMTENQAIYAHLGYRETGRRTENGYHRVFMQKDLPPA